MILAYGSIEAIGRATGNYAIYNFIKAILCTSAFMHYCYDGFIWKVRKKEFRQNLVAGEAGPAGDRAKEGLRWWYLMGGRRGRRWAGIPYFLGFGGERSGRFGAYASEGGRQVLYFGAPIIFLAWTDTTYSLPEVEAREYLTRLTPSVAKVYDDLGKTYTRRGEFGRAIEAHQKAIELDPELPQAHYNLGVDYLRQGLPHKALAAFEQAIALEADYSRAYEAIGRIYQDQGDKERAERAMERARRSSRAAKRKSLGRNALPWTTGTSLEVQDP